MQLQQPAAAAPTRLQAAAAAASSNEILQRPVQNVFMTPMQMQMHQQLKAKHAELFKKIVEQQEELRKVSEQLFMTQYHAVAGSSNAAAESSPLTTPFPVHNITQPSSNISGDRESNNSSLFGPLEIQMPYDNVMTSQPTGNSTTFSQQQR